MENTGEQLISHYQGETLLSWILTKHSRGRLAMIFQCATQLVDCRERLKPPAKTGGFVVGKRVVLGDRLTRPPA